MFHYVLQVRPVGFSRLPFTRQLVSLRSRVDQASLAPSIWIMFFFFSSRRRHTRFDCDWSSDVCSSDLIDQIRPFRGYRSITIIQPRFNSNYHSLQVSLARRFSGASQINGAYTWSRNMTRSEEHTSELQSQSNLVCRLLLEKKKQTITVHERAVDEDDVREAQIAALRSSTRPARSQVKVRSSRPKCP